MSKPKLGPWMPASVKPVHIGVYQTAVSKHEKRQSPVFNYFDGIRWLSGGRVALSVESAASEPSHYFGVPFEWRGLAEKPDA